MAIIANLYIDQGTDYTITVDVTTGAGEVLNLTGYTAAAQMRKTYKSSSITATFTTAVSEAAGQVTLSLTDTQTAAIADGRYVYDMTITDDSSPAVTTRVVEGQAVITPGVTR
jgi:hypothetical protein